ncbi:MAG: RNA 2',3'-cyclic phosphodiesterase [Synergistes sp.]|nr:RNA 2',3'-cyclic phosphodiesterase [Synergistes sp.]
MFRTMPHISSGTLRTFICIKLPEEHTAALAKWLSAVRRTTVGVRWVLPGTIHITLKFCGEITRTTVDKISGMLSQENLGGKIKISAGGVGGFPNLNNPRVIWTSVDGEVDKLEILRQKIEKCTSMCGVPSEYKKFSPHITLGRNNSDRPLSPETLRQIKITGISLPEWEAEEIIFMKSVLGRGGPTYTPLKKFVL